MRQYQIQIGLLLATAVLLGGCVSWEETYDPDDENPYGVSVLPEVLKESFLADRYEELPVNWADEGLVNRFESRATYVAIGPGLLYGPTEVAALDSFVMAGGTALLAAEEIGYAVLDSISRDSCLHEVDLMYHHVHDSLITAVSARGDTLPLPSLVEYVGQSYFGSAMYIDTSCVSGVEHLLVSYDSVGKPARIDTSDFDALMLRVRRGRGAYVLLSQPRLLSNIHATHPDGRRLYEEVLSYLPRDPEVVLFDYERRSTVQEVINQNARGYRPTKYFDPEDNILKHILRRPPLAAAWYSLLGGVIIFLGFGAKRQQRVVPLTQPRRNTTHEYLGNIARLYLGRGNNLLMARKQLALFEAFCQRRFGVNPLRDEAAAVRVKRMRGVDATTLDSILRYANTVSRGQTITNQGFIRLVRLIQDFRDSVHAQR